jgi:LmbE family N-acetylglucosaminyl deacetylase
MKKMLLVFAHPDDESFSAGGTIFQYAKNGWHISLITATNGEKGSFGPYTDETGNILGERRQEELKKAAKLLGIEHIEFLEFPDFGLKQLTPGTLEDPIYIYMKTTLPDIVITHDPTGITNHPDHTKVCYAVTYAFQKYAAHLNELQDPEKQMKGRGKIWKQAEYARAFSDTHLLSKEPKLYYACLPQRSVDFLLKEKQIPEESFGKPFRGVPDKDVTTVIDITVTQLIKGKALLCYETQAEDVDRFISFAQNPEVKQECYILRMQGVYEVFMGKNDRVSDRL